MSLTIPAWVRRLFRIPGDPEPPPGDPSALRVFHAGAGYLRYKLMVWAIGQTFALAAAIGFGVFAGGIGFDGAEPELWRFWVFGAPAYLIFFGQLVLSFFALRLDYDLRWYMLGDDALRIREGVLTVRERTMSYANIQQVSVKRGPLQSLLGIGDVEVRSAGGGAVKQGERDEHRGFFRGVANPEEVSDLIRSRVERHRGSGLGETDASPAGHLPRREVVTSGVAMGIAGALVDEIRGLRRDLRRGAPETRERGEPGHR